MNINHKFLEFTQSLHVTILSHQSFSHARLQNSKVIKYTNPVKNVNHPRNEYLIYAHRHIKDNIKILI